MAGWPARAISGGVKFGLMLGMGAVLMAAIAIATIVRRGSAVPQPVAFNHAKHTQELELTCEFCHPYVQTGAHSGLPDATTCSICHTAVQGESTEAARVTELLTEGDPLRFNKLFYMPDHVFYTHRRHVAVAELPCESCHGDIAATERPPRRALMRVDMDFCMNCHKEQGATLDCNACHR
jgi:predicted CXXCH cytochrome family protein